MRIILKQNTVNIETTTGTIKLKNKTVRVTSAYKSPQKDMIESDLDILAQDKTIPHIIAGDLNSKTIY